MIFKIPNVLLCSSAMSKRKVTFEGVNEELDLEDVPPNKKVSLLNTWLHLQLFIVAVVAMIFGYVLLFLFCSELRAHEWPGLQV